MLPIRRNFVWVFVAMGLLTLTGCSPANKDAAGAGAGAAAAGKFSTLDGQREITPDQLNDLTRSYADRLVALIASTADDLRRGDAGDAGDGADGSDGASGAVNPPTPAQRKRAQLLKVNTATAAYDIASQPDPFARVLDLVVLATLQSQYWIDDGMAQATFGARGRALVAALRRARVEAQGMAARVMTHEQLELLDYLIWSWRRANPGVERVEFVRFADFATARGGGATGAAAAAAAAARASGLFASVRRAAAAVDETRAMMDRALYLLQREPTLLRWQAETFKADIVATPEVARTLADIDRLTHQVELAPVNVATQRKELLAAFDEREKTINSTVTNVRGAIADADKAITALGQTGKSLTEMMNSTKAVLASFDDYSRRHPSEPTTQPSHPFDVREYTEALKQLATAMDQMNQLVGSSNNLLSSSVWDRRIEQLNDAADGRVRQAATHSRELVDTVFRRVYISLGLLLAVLVSYRVIAALLVRWLHKQTEHANSEPRALGPAAAVPSKLRVP